MLVAGVRERAGVSGKERKPSFETIPERGSVTRSTQEWQEWQGPIKLQPDKLSHRYLCYGFTSGTPANRLLKITSNKPTVLASIPL